MSAIASQLVLHPTVSHTLTVLGTTLGRDKAYRALQYLSRFLSWYLLRRGATLEAARWNALKNAMASCRKMMRLGKPMEHLQAALKATQLQAPTFEQLTAIGRQLGYAGYLTYDGLAWASSIKFLKFEAEKTQKWTKISFRFWLTGILFSITHGLFKAGRLANEHKALKSGRTVEKESISSEAERAALRQTIQRQKQAVQSQMTLDILDVWIPSSNLGFVNLNDGIVGLLGFATSVMAFNTHWANLLAKK